MKPLVKHRVYKVTYLTGIIIKETITYEPWKDYKP